MADAGTGAAMAAMAAASITVAGIQATASTDAATIQTTSANRTADLIDARFQLMRADFQPYRDVGAGAVGQLSERLNEFTSTANPYAAAMDAEMPTLPIALTQGELENTPGFQFVRDQGLRATQISMAARGLGVSGAAIQAAVTYVTGLASQIYNTRFAQQQVLFGNQQQRFANITTRFTLDQGLLVNAFNRLNTTVTLGQNSAAQVGKTGVESANQAGAAIMAGANGAAGSVLAGANSLSGGVNGLANAYQSFQQQKAYGITGGSSTYSDNNLKAVDGGKWSLTDQSVAEAYNRQYEGGG